MTHQIRLFTDDDERPTLQQLGERLQAVLDSSPWLELDGPEPAQPPAREPSWTPQRRLRALRQRASR